MRAAKQAGRRIGMSILALAAFAMTFHTFSGVSAEEIQNWMLEQSSFLHEQGPLEAADLSYMKEGSVLHKSLPTFTTEEKSKSSEAVQGEPITLEDAVDWEQYPSKRVTATGYTAGVESTGKNPGDQAYGITFSGTRVKRDLYSTIAADPQVFPIGTILFIPGYGYGVVADTGSAIKGEKIDLYYETVEDVFEQWGRQEVTVFVVKEGIGSMSDEELEALNEDESVQVFREQMNQ